MDGGLAMKFSKPMRFSDKFVEEIYKSRTRGRRLDGKEPHEFISIVY